MVKANREPSAITRMEAAEELGSLMDELRDGLGNYFRRAEKILEPGGVKLRLPPPADLTIEKHFFSLLFLYSFFRGGVPAQRRVLYVTMLQCLRGMVTGCDNLLDDEYKVTLESDIPANGVRFRSVVDIMVSDRVLFETLLAICNQEGLSLDRAVAAATASMRTLLRSGVQEASEEGGVADILTPGAVLEHVHHFKTGLLFQCPWDVPLTIESIPAETVEPLLDGLYRIGMGCQILDDMVDFAGDIETKRNNYVVSLIHHGEAGTERELLATLLEQRDERVVQEPATAFPLGFTTARRQARCQLEQGLTRLFGPGHAAWVDLSIQFLENRIGSARLGLAEAP